MRDNQRGFTLIEVIIAMTLTAGVTLAVISAVTKAIHTSAVATQAIGLRDDALSVLADLRAATIYDPQLLRSMLLKSTTTTISIHPNGAPETVTVRIDPLLTPQQPVGVSAIAQATVSFDGATVVERAMLYTEAPAPGSTVNQ